MAAKSKRTYYILAAIVVIAVVAALIAKNNGMGGKKEVPEVEVTAVKKVDIVERVSASGKVQPEVEVKISPDVSGEVIEMTVEEGDSVTKGELLCRIRPDNYQSMLDRSQAALSTSRASLAQAKSVLAQSEARLVRSKEDFERNKKLYDQNVISASDFEVSRANYNIALKEIESQKANVQASGFNVASSEAAVKDAAETLRKTAIYAPMSGTVSKLSIEKGERVVGTSQMAGTEIMRIANLRNMEVLIDVNENDIVRVAAGDTADIDVDSYSSQNRKFKGLVTSIANTAKATASLDVVTEFEVKVRILPESYTDLLAGKKKGYSPFRPGMTASVDVLTNSRKGVLSVPLNAVTTRAKNQGDGNNNGGNNGGGGPSDGVSVNDNSKKTKEEKPETLVFVLKNGKAVKQVVETGISDMDNIEITKGLNENDKAISGPYLLVSKKLEDGTEVKEKQEPKADGKKPAKP